MSLSLSCRLQPSPRIVYGCKSSVAPLGRRCFALYHGGTVLARRSGSLQTPHSPCPAWQRQCRRAAKTSTRIKAVDLPQGAVPLAPLQRDAETPKYPTVVQQARNNMRKFEKCVLLTRVGSFYELYFEQAEQYGPLLNLKVAQKKTNAGPVPMAGFPFFQLDRFLKTLVQELEQHVAISEEIANTESAKVKSGGLLFDRKVCRVITPGTLIDERFMNTAQNNFLLSIHVDDRIASIPRRNPVEKLQAEDGIQIESIGPSTVGLAWLDLSTGDFFTQSTDAQSLASAAARIGPREIIIDKEIDLLGERGLHSLVEENSHIMSHHAPRAEIPSVDAWSPLLEHPLSEIEAKQFTPEEASAGTSLLDYLDVQLQGLNMKLQPPVRRHTKETMSIDKNSMRALEIKTTLREGLTKGSLLHAMSKTVTNSGTRLLNDWLTAPSTSISIINARLDLVSSFLRDAVIRDEVVRTLKTSYDSQRIVQKFSLARGDADDLVALCKSIEATGSIAEILTHCARGSTESPASVSGEMSISAESGNQTSACIGIMLSRLDLEGPRTLAERIAEAIDEDGLMQRQSIQEDEAASVISMAQEVAEAEGIQLGSSKASKKAKARIDIGEAAKAQDAEDEDVWVMRKCASTTLSRLHDQLGQLRREKAELAESLRQSHGANSLTLRWTPGLGHICHVKGKDAQSSLSSLDKVRRVSSSKSTQSFHLPEWTKLGTQMDQVKMQIRTEENQVFRILRDEVILNLAKLRRNAAVLDELDIACSFAVSAENQSLVRPILTSAKDHKIVGGRHPMVERGLEEQGRNFITNDCFVGEKERIWLITGPNMAGKSTFLRQNALISIMAQAGSFVPAEYAEIGIVDQVFSRIGSADNLYQDQSTFMVEMLETAAILKQATPRSFVIMDEVGRGTTCEDGIAVGFACLDHLYHVNQCRTLFATHFHSLTDMTQSMERLTCYCTDVVQDGSGSFSYVHRLRRGVNKQSHALKVARLAGVPARAIETAERVLNTLKESNP